MVDISKKMVADQYGFNVSLKEGDSWQYLVNEDVDNIKPEFKSLTITDSAQTANQSAFPSCETIKNAFPSLSNIFYSKNHKFLVNAEIYDKSGISELYIEMQKILGATYKAGDQLLRGEPVTVYQVPLKVIGDTAKCKDTEIDLSDYADGVYKMTFKTSDNSGIETVYGTPFYITKDYTPVAISALKLRIKNTTGTKDLDSANICPTPYISSSFSNYQACYSDDGIIKVTGTLPLQNESDVESIEVKAFKYSSELFDTAAGAMNQEAGTYSIDFTQTEEDYKISDFNIDLSPYGNGLYKLIVCVKDKDGNAATSTFNAVLDSLAEVEFAGPEFSVYSYGSINSARLRPGVLNTYKLKTSASPFQSIIVEPDRLTYTPTSGINYFSKKVGPLEAGTILNESYKYTNYNVYELFKSVSSGGQIKSICHTETTLPATIKIKEIPVTTVLPPSIVTFSKDSAIEIQFRNSTYSGNTKYDYVDLYLDDSTESILRLSSEETVYSITGLTNGKKYKITAVPHPVDLAEDTPAIPSVIYETPSPYPLNGHVLYKDNIYSSNYYSTPTPVGMVYDLNNETKEAKLLALPEYFSRKAFALESYKNKNNSSQWNSFYVWDHDLIYTTPSDANYNSLTDLIPAAGFINQYYAGTYPKAPADITTEGPNQYKSNNISYYNWYLPSINELKNIADNYSEKLDALLESSKATGSIFPDYKTSFWSSSTDTSKKSRYESYVGATINAYYYDFTNRNVNPKSCDKKTELSVMLIVNIDLNKF